MAQLSIYDKQRHFSDKDFTCSIGKYNKIYLTFRNYSWLRFTKSEKMAIYIGKSGALRFDDPEKGIGLVLKMKTSPKDSEAAKSTRYVQLSGEAYPRILEVVRRLAGSYNFPDQPKDVDGVVVTTDPKPDIVKEDLAKFTALTMKKHRPDKVTSEELAEAFKPCMDQLVVKTDDDIRRDNFLADAARLTSMATSTEERTAIYNALAAVYGGNASKPSKVIPMPKEETEEERKKWEV